MNLEYNVLWVDDVAVWVKSKQRLLKSDFAQRFLELKVDYCKSVDSAIKQLKQVHSYDMILVDYKFGKKKEGAELIEKIRKMEIFSTIVFYSQDGESILRKELADKELEGVFCLDRTTGFGSNKFKEIIANTIRRTEDPNFIRGLVMAETSDFDMDMLELKKAIISDSELPSDKQQKISKKAKEYITDQSKQNTKQANESSVIDLVSKAFFDSNKKYRLLKYCLTDKEYALLKDYKEEIIDERNIFAHAKEEINDGVKQLVSHIDPEPRIIDDELCSEIRRVINKYKESFKILKEKYGLSSVV